MSARIPAMSRFAPIAAALAGVAMLSLMDGFMKGAALAAGTYSATLLRSAIACALVAPIWLLRGGRWPKGEVLRLHLARGVVSAFMALTFFYALTELPIAEAIALSFVAPLLALYLARLLLGETIRRTAIGGSVLGFAGTLVIATGRLQNSDFDSGTALALLSLFVSALLYAFNFILIRQQSQRAAPLEIATFHGGVAAAILALGAPFHFTAPPPDAWIQLGLAGLLTVGGAMAIAWAYARAEAQVLVPMEYSGFLWAALFGWLLFAEPVSWTTLAGVVLIVGGCVMASRSQQSEEPAGGAPISQPLLPDPLLPDPPPVDPSGVEKCGNHPR